METKKLSFNLGDVFFGTGDTFPRDTTQVGPLVSTLLKNAIVVAGIFAVLAVVFGGISMISSAGQNNPQKAAQARNTVTWGVIGFIVVFAAYWIVQLIEVLSGIEIL